MKLKCKKNLLNESDKLKFSGSVYLKEDFHLTVNKEYLALGFSIGILNNQLICSVEHLTDFNHIVTSPLTLFEIIEKKVSKYWTIKVWEDGDVTFWPELFYEQYFHEDHGDGKLETIKRFNEIYKKMCEEFNFHYYLDF